MESNYWEIRVVKDGEIISRHPVGSSRIEAQFRFTQFKLDMCGQGYNVNPPRVGNKQFHFVARDDEYRYDVWLVNEPSPARLA